jgi:phosphatidate cytidylyltransferase
MVNDYLSPYPSRPAGAPPSPNGRGVSPRFIKRLISALLLGPVALFLLVAHPISFFLVVVPAFLLACYEWLGVIRGCQRRKKWVMLVGLVYIPAAFGAFTVLRFGVPPDGGWMTCLWLLLTVWASDTGAYIFGKAYGGPKWVPSISPNKTWAGLGGAMLGAGLVTMIFGLVTYQMQMGPFEYSRDFVYGAVLGLVCQLGDLFISVFKRRAGLKDTGNLIPGHGGILDRIDSLMMAAIFTFLILKLV